MNLPPGRTKRSSHISSLLDQFYNIYRNTPRAFAGDAGTGARYHAGRSRSRQEPRALAAPALPTCLQACRSPIEQERSVALFAALARERRSQLTFDSDARLRDPAIARGSGPLRPLPPIAMPHPLGACRQQRKRPSSPSQLVVLIAMLDAALVLRLRQAPGSWYSPAPDVGRGGIPTFRDRYDPGLWAAGRSDGDRKRRGPFALNHNASGTSMPPCRGRCHRGARRRAPRRYRAPRLRGIGSDSNNQNIDNLHQRAGSTASSNCTATCCA